MIKTHWLPYIKGVSNILEGIRCLKDHGLKEKLQFIVAAVLHRDAFLTLTQVGEGGIFDYLDGDRSRYVSFLIAPYVDSRWSSTERVYNLKAHASTLDGRLERYNFSASQSLYLLDLGEFGIPNYHIIINKPLWFSNEGLITLNILKNSFRFFSLTFSFYSEGPDIGIIIGGIQGRKAESILSQYREFTKLANGLRPRDFIFEVLRIIARAEDVKCILGIPDRYRYHRHKYFKQNRRDLHLNYDEIWKDRGGVLNTDGMYELPLVHNRTLERIPARKRTMYRKRYDLLERMEAKISLQLQIAKPINFDKVD